MDAAKKRLEGQNVEFMEGSSEELPLADASFDRYAANFVLYVAPSSPSSPHKSTLHAVDHRSCSDATTFVCLLGTGIW
jgi:hypothetical protein